MSHSIRELKSIAERATDKGEVVTEEYVATVMPDGQVAVRVTDRDAWRNPARWRFHIDKLKTLAHVVMSDPKRGTGALVSWVVVEEMEVLAKFTLSEFWVCWSVGELNVAFSRGEKFLEEHRREDESDDDDGMGRLD